MFVRVLLRREQQIPLRSISRQLCYAAVRRSFIQQPRTAAAALVKGRISQWQITRPKSDAVTKGSDGGRGKQLASERPFAELTVAEKVVETSKDAGSLGVILAGTALGVFFLGSIGKQLLFSESPRSVYTDTLERLQRNDELEEVIGSMEGGKLGAGFNPFRSSEYIVGDNNLLRMQFDINGSKGSGVVHLEMKKPKSFIGSTLKSYRYRYLFVDCEDIMGQKRRLILEDNRSED
eukprot:gene7375-513_t